jgi:flagellar motor protein MotB
LLRAKRAPHAGWAITFADLMGLLVSFFVMLTVLLAQSTAQFDTTKQAMQRVFGKNAQEVIVRIPPPLNAENKALEAKIRALLAKDETLTPLTISHEKDVLRIEIKAVKAP